MHLEAHARELANGDLELIAYNQKIYEKQKGRTCIIEDVENTQSANLALPADNDRPVFDDMQRGVMAVLVAFETQSSKGRV